MRVSAVERFRQNWSWLMFKEGEQLQSGWPFQAWIEHNRTDDIESNAILKEREYAHDLRTFKSKAKGSSKHDDQQSN